MKLIICLMTIAFGVMNYNNPTIKKVPNEPGFRTLQSISVDKEQQEICSLNRILNNRTSNIQDSFDHYFAVSKKSWNDKENFKKWTEKQDTGVYTLGYFRGDCCGGVPDPNKMFANVINDTIYFDYKIQRDPNCNSEIGICGTVIVFIINTKKYPNYRNLIWKEEISIVKGKSTKPK